MNKKDEANETEGQSTKYYRGKIEELLNLLVQRDKYIADLKLVTEELKSDLRAEKEELIERSKDRLENYNYTNDLLAENGRLRDKMLEARRSLSY